MRIVVLGAVHMYRGGREVPAGPPQRQAMLVALALRAGHTVALADLVDAVWGQNLPNGPVATIRTYAWQLRRSIESDPSVPSVLLSSGDGYRLAVPGAGVDALRAESLVRRAARERGAGRAEEARELLIEALALWHGHSLSGVPGPYAYGQRARLEELRLTLVEERLALDVHLGDASSALPPLAELTRAHPLREQPQALLMRALCATGRRAEALASFTAYRVRMAEELGIGPGPELTGLHARILRDDLGPRVAGGNRTPRQSVPAQTATPVRSGRVSPVGMQGVHPPTRPPAQLPPAPADFTGRDAETARLCGLLTSADRPVPAIVSVTGMAGTGKTALTLRAAHRVRSAYPDGQLYADLSGRQGTPTGPAAVLATFLRALGVAAADIPDGVDDRSRLMRSVLDGRRVLIVLDDVHDPAELALFLPGSAGSGVAVTHRTGLAGLPVSGRIDLGMFRREESLALFRAVAGSDRVDREHAAALAVAESCGHLPLAVRIAASRMAARPGRRISDLALRLADERRRLKELRLDGLTVEAAFAASYRRLSADQVAAMGVLAPVAGPDVSLTAAATALRMAEDAAEDLLESLVDAALLQTPRAGSYRFHDLVRCYALQQTGGTGEATLRVLRGLPHPSPQSVAGPWPGAESAR
ncbi:BTAD domain-containing putative transcriptional regulator [Streptomyces sp. BE147]|uniref:AfsR/SARP family transcriptional regulator n=1 Tax=Streptomyces sp. BE147 TaxID=3002524 RepID=UPI002E7A0383|nr:BTAD domain-containing putative transcriptional regulator [Streptomyces sp. BE147]MEE1736919.1 BTAD domain-containing putative transcriptional regulator [Streptomyces sp. BE147]